MNNLFVIIMMSFALRSSAEDQKEIRILPCSTDLTVEMHAKDPYAIYKYTEITCPTCGGSGVQGMFTNHTVMPDWIPGTSMMRHECTTCDGNGKVMKREPRDHAEPTAATKAQIDDYNLMREVELRAVDTAQEAMKLQADFAATADGAASLAGEIALSPISSFVSTLMVDVALAFAWQFRAHNYYESELAKTGPGLFWKQAGEPVEKTTNPEELEQMQRALKANQLGMLIPLLHIKVGKQQDPKVAAQLEHGLIFKKAFPMMAHVWFPAFKNTHTGPPGSPERQERRVRQIIASAANFLDNPERWEKEIPAAAGATRSLFVRAGNAFKSKVVAGLATCTKNVILRAERMLVCLSKGAAVKIATVVGKRHMAYDIMSAGIATFAQTAFAKVIMDTVSENIANTHRELINQKYDDLVAGEYAFQAKTQKNGTSEILEFVMNKLRHIL